jgi:hypothetical protein
MKIEVLMYNEEGQVVGKAIETACNSLIVNGVHVISNGGVNAEMRDLLGATTAQDIGMTLVPPLRIELKNLGGIKGANAPFFYGTLFGGQFGSGIGLWDRGGDTKIGRPVETHTRTGSLSNKIHFFYISFILVLQSVHM